MTRSYKAVRPKKHHVYSIEDLMARYCVCRNTVSNWIGEGLRPSDDGIPKVFRGDVVRQFHEGRRLRHRIVVRANEALCLRCKRAVVPAASSIGLRPCALGSRLQFGTCPDCQGQTTRILDATSCDLDRDCRNPNTTPDQRHEEVAPDPGGIGNDGGFDRPDLHFANDRTVYAWLGYAGRYSPKTIDRHLAAIRYLEGVTEGKPFDQLSRTDVSKVRDDLKRRAKFDAPDHWSASSIRHMRSHLVAFLTWLQKQEGFRRLPRDLPDYLELPRSVTAHGIPPAQKNYPTLAEAERLLAGMSAKSLIDQRARAIFALAFLGALRADTLASLCINHVDIENRRIRQDASLVRTKAGKSLEISWFPIPVMFEETVIDWIETLHGLGFTADDTLFPCHTFLKHRVPKPGGVPVPVMTTKHAVTSAFALACRDSAQTYTPHAAKHAIAAERDTRPLTQMQRKAWSENMGHENEQTTERYYGKLSNEDRIELIAEIGEVREDQRRELTVEEKAAIFDAAVDWHRTGRETRE